MLGYFACMWYGKLYCHMQGSAAGHVGHWSRTLEDRLDAVEMLAVAYEKFTYFTHVDFAKST